MSGRLHLASCLAISCAAVPSSNVSQVGTPRVCLSVSVDWEGVSLASADLEAIQRFRSRFPKLPLTHFFNAAYYTHDDADARAVTASFKRVLRPRDEVGLHIHAWESLVEVAGQSPLDGPSFLGQEDFVLAGELGFDIELGAYSTEAVLAMVQASLKIFQQAGLRPSKTFRAGGWNAPPPVLEAVRRAGLLIDSSASHAGWYEEVAHLGLQRRIQQIWPKIDVHTQPFEIPTPAGPIIEAPLTGGMADYVTAEQMLNHIREARAHARRRGAMQIAQLGFHQENAADHISRLEDALSAVSDAPEVFFDTVQGCVNRSRNQVRELN